MSWQHGCQLPHLTVHMPPGVQHISKTPLLRQDRSTQLTHSEVLQGLLVITSAPHMENPDGCTLDGLFLCLCAAALCTLTATAFQESAFALTSRDTANKILISMKVSLPELQDNVWEIQENVFHLGVSVSIYKKSSSHYHYEEYTQCNVKYRH